MTKSIPTERLTIAVIVPTRNASSTWDEFEIAVKRQGLDLSQITIVDSSSEDGTASKAKKAGFQVVSIQKESFNHGGTRQWALSLIPWATIVVYLTQDAILTDGDAITRLIEPFANPEVGAVFGRQLPRIGAGPIETHARLFNYPEQSAVRTFESRHTLGIKAAFLSNSFSAYRVSALLSVGGFPEDIIMGEDAIVAARLLMNGYKTCYVADAMAYHSHAYSTVEEFRRYFDTGVYHHRYPWLMETFGKADGEGKKFVLSELRYLRKHGIHLIPSAILRTAAKAAGYKLGLREDWLNSRLCRLLSLHRGFWEVQGKLS